MPSRLGRVSSFLKLASDIDTALPYENVSIVFPSLRWWDLADYFISLKIILHLYL